MWSASGQTPLERIPTTPARGALIFGHELVHDYNVYHTDTADACGSNDNNSDFPYGNSSIQEVGYNPITGKIYNPALTHDLMSYCPSGGRKQGWIAPFTWTKMFNDFALSRYSTQIDVNNQPYIMHPTAAGELLVVNATVYNPDLNPEVPGALGELYRTEGGVAYTLPPEIMPSSCAMLTEPYWPVIPSWLISKASTAQTRELTPVHIGTRPPPFPAEPTSKVDVSFIVPWMDGTYSVTLVHQGNLLDQRVVSNNPPQVLITSPTGAETWNHGETHTISWQGLDLDGDPLVYTLFYSNNGGSDWVLLQGDLTQPSYTVDVTAWLVEAMYVSA